MSQQYDNTNRGVLFKNDDKQSDTHADYRGSINVGGTEYWLDAWIKTSKADRKYMSLSIKPKMAPGNRPPTGGKNDPRPVDAFDDDINF